MSEVIEKSDPGVKKVNQPVTYTLGWLLIISSIAYWTNNQDPSSPTIINKVGLTFEWLMLAHLILTIAGLFLLWLSRYSEEIGKKLSLKFYDFVVFIREREITNLSSTETEKLQDPFFSIFNLVKVILIGLLALIGLELIFSFMSKVTIISSLNIVLIITLLPISLVWVNLKKLSLTDFIRLTPGQGKSKVYGFSNSIGAIEVSNNQIAYIKVADENYKLISAGKTAIVNGTNCRIFFKSFFSIKKDALRLHSDLKSDGSEMTISVEIEPNLGNFPKNIIDKRYTDFINFFSSENLDNQIYSVIPFELIKKANNAKNISFKNLHEFILPAGKSEAEVNNITNNLFDKEIYIETSTQIRYALLSYFDKLLDVENAFNITVELDDKLDRTDFSRKLNHKVEDYFKSEEIRKTNEKQSEVTFEREVKIEAIKLTETVINKQGLPQEEQKVVVGTGIDIITNINSGFKEIAQKHHTPDKLELYARELIDAHDFVLNHDEMNNESKIQYLQEKSFFTDYPKVSPIHLYSKIIEMDRNQREEKMKQVLKELISSNRLTNG